MLKPIVLVVDDHDNFRESLLASPLLNQHYALCGASTGEQAIALAKQEPHLACIVLDYNLKGQDNALGINGLDVLKQLASIAPHIPIIMMSGVTEGRGQVAIDAVRNYAVCFLDKPFHNRLLLEKLQTVAQSLPAVAAYLQEAQALLCKHGFISASKSMQHLCGDIVAAAESQFNVVILGETGCGKTALARAMHSVSPRSRHPFIMYNCGEAGNDRIWMKDDLFGHTANAFNGAREKKGLLLEAGEGTMFLDEITDMPFPVQSGLLQVLQNRTFRRLGDTEEHSFKARVIAASNVSLAEAVKEGKLREDLKFRLCTEVLTIPPLRTRPDDIPAIVEAFLERTPSDVGIRVRHIAPEAVVLLQRQPWIGNIRQLEHVLLRASAYETSPVITPTTIRHQLWKEYGLEEECDRWNTERAAEESLDDAIHRIRREYIVQALRRTGGNLTLAAQILGFANHSGLRHWFGKYNIQPREYQ